MADGRSRRAGRVRLPREYERPFQHQIISLYDSAEVRGEVGEERDGELIATMWKWRGSVIR